MCGAAKRLVIGRKPSIIWSSPSFRTEERAAIAQQINDEDAVLCPLFFRILCTEILWDAVGIVRPFPKVAEMLTSTPTR